MDDAPNTPQEAAATAAPEAQDAQVAAPEAAAEAPATQAADTAETTLYAGKYKSVQDLEASYKELERKFHEERQQRPAEPPTDMGNRTAAPDTGDLPFDPETVQGLSTFYTRMRQAELAAEEARKAAEFQRRHADDLSDPLLTARVASIIQAGNSRGEYVDQEAALSQAKRELDERLKPRVEQAQASGFEEGQETALRKQQAGAVGDVSSKVPPKDDSQLTSREFAEKYGIPRT